jgi:hypothetical protein
VHLPQDFAKKWRRLLQKSGKHSQWQAGENTRKADWSVNYRFPRDRSYALLQVNPAAFYLRSTEMISTATSTIQNRQLQGRFGKRALGRRPGLLKFNFGETRVPARKGGARAAALECGVAFSVEDKSCQALNFYAALHGLSARPGSNYRFQI